MSNISHQRDAPPANPATIPLSTTLVPINAMTNPSRHSFQATSRMHRKMFVWLTVLLVIFASACSTDGGEITAYPMLCDAPVVNQTCSGRATPLNRETFRVFAASQQVVSWLPGIRETPVSLEQCSVRDGHNWKCHLPRNQGEVGFANGEFTETLTPPRSDQEKFFYVGGVKWWWHQLVASRL